MKADLILEQEYLVELELHAWARYLATLDLAPSVFVQLWRVALRMDHATLRGLNDAVERAPSPQGRGARFALHSVSSSSSLGPQPASDRRKKGQR